MLINAIKRIFKHSSLVLFVQFTTQASQIKAQTYSNGLIYIKDKECKKELILTFSLRIGSIGSEDLIFRAGRNISMHGDNTWIKKNWEYYLIVLHFV